MTRTGRTLLGVAVALVLSGATLGATLAMLLARTLFRDSIRAKFSETRSANRIVKKDMNETVIARRSQIRVRLSGDQ